MPTCRHLPPLVLHIQTSKVPTCWHPRTPMSYIYRPLKCWYAYRSQFICCTLCKCRPATWIEVPQFIYWALYISASYKCQLADLPTTSTCVAHWRINLYVINPNSKMVDLVRDCAVLPILIFCCLEPLQRVLRIWGDWEVWGKVEWNHISGFIVPAQSLGTKQILYFSGSRNDSSFR